LQLLRGEVFGAVETLKSCLDVSRLMFEQIEVNSEAIDDEKYEYIFSVEEVNKKVQHGVPFRVAYQRVGKNIEEGKFNPDRTINHTHEGSIGNLCNDEVREKFDKAFNITQSYTE
jgi:argininosuccinate lyase